MKYPILSVCSTWLRNATLAMLLFVSSVPCSAQIKYADRVQETTTTTGTDTLDLDGASAQHQGFVSGVGDGAEAYYGLIDANDTDWETGIGTVTDASPDTISRDTILASSNSGSAINLSAGTHTVYLIAPATRFARNDLRGEASSVTTADVTGEVGVLHRLDLSGLTADRVFDLPDGAAVDERVGVYVTTGDASFELDIETEAAGSQINGVDAGSGTGWSRLYITDERAVFRCIKAGGAGDTDWVLEIDGRIPSFGAMSLSADQTGLSDATWNTVDLDQSDDDVGDIVDTTNHRFNIRRDGVYHLIWSIRPQNSITSGTWYLSRSFKNGSTIINAGTLDVASDSSTLHSTPGQTFHSLVDGDYVQIEGRFDWDTTPAFYSDDLTVFMINEQL